MRCNRCYSVLHPPALSLRGFPAFCNVTDRSVTVGVTVGVTYSDVMLQNGPLTFTGAAFRVSQGVTGVTVWGCGDD